MKFIPNQFKSDGGLPLAEEALNNYLAKLLGCAGGSTTTRLDLFNVGANRLLHGSAELACHLVWAAGFASDFCQYGSHAPYHGIAFLVRKFDHIDGQALGGFPSLVKYVSHIG
jgi:hypothetical protein